MKFGSGCYVLIWHARCHTQKNDLGWRNMMTNRNMVKQLHFKLHSYLLCNLSVSVSWVHAYKALRQVMGSCMRKQSVMCQKQHIIVSCANCASGFQGARLVMKITTNSLLCFLVYRFYHVPSYWFTRSIPEWCIFLSGRVGWKLNLNPLGCSLSDAMLQRDWCVGDVHRSRTITDSWRGSLGHLDAVSDCVALRAVSPGPGGPLGHLIVFATVAQASQLRNGERPFTRKTKNYVLSL